MRPLVAIVGAPNVGKSTLFNRLVAERRAIVTPEPGVTRDRLYGEVTDAPLPFRIVDTGGLTPRTEAPFAREIERQAEAALDEAALVFFVVDARAGATALDLDLAAMLRRRNQPVVLVANKIDEERTEERVPLGELERLGLGSPVPISAEHNRNIDVLLDIAATALERGGPNGETPDEAEDEPLAIALVGRPNVGKSSILNRLVREVRSIFSDIPGTTRDAIDTLVTLG
jgi:GTP-binding protein